MIHLNKILNSKPGPPINTIICLVTAGIVVAIVLLLTGCAPSQSAIQTAIAMTETARPTNTSTPLPPSTSTPVPSNTPIAPTATPVFEVFTPEQVVAAFKEAGLEAESPMPMAPADYAMAPLVATKGIYILIPSMCSDCGGRVFSFANEADRKILADYYTKLGRASAAFFSWVFERDNILVQINGDLPEAKAMKYKQVLDSLKP